MPEEYYSLTEEQPRIDDVQRQKKLKLTDQVFLRCVCKNNDAEKKIFFSQVNLLLLIFDGTDILLFIFLRYKIYYLAQYFLQVFVFPELN